MNKRTCIKLLAVLVALCLLFTTLPGAAVQVNAAPLTEADAQALGFTFEAIGATELCPEGTYKVALVCHPGHDFHWYRQNSDGTWSHKRDTSEVVNVDADGNVIYNPQTADRSYEDANYSVFVGFFYVSPL